MRIGFGDGVAAPGRPYGPARGSSTSSGCRQQTRARPPAAKPLEELVEPDGIEPTTSTMPLSKKSNGNKDMT